ncbi:hypothetical protein JKP88DRAFT_241688 [Tribonema minus]|uniref:Uncharacterized protein n=1 Tax=Tribonema minus TaxID=303371 RepID=A0A836CAZ5_9STRA|nr:hypothetical protein JKP88DRAFT_241688 [Tribonema minus]
MEALRCGMQVVSATGIRETPPSAACDSPGGIGVLRAAAHHWSSRPWENSRSTMMTNSRTLLASRGRRLWQPLHVREAPRSMHVAMWPHSGHMHVLPASPPGSMMRVLDSGRWLICVTEACLCVRRQRTQWHWRCIAAPDGVHRTHPAVSYRCELERTSLYQRNGHLCPETSTQLGCSGCSQVQPAMKALLAAEKAAMNSFEPEELMRSVMIVLRHQ